MRATAPTLKSLRVGLLQFPGSNCDVDCAKALSRCFEIEAKIVWHDSRKLPDLDVVFIPGGFSFGDYLRSGALAAHSPVMQEVREFVEKNGSVFGICNGFQILVESKILPGVLLHNENLEFICKMVTITDANKGIYNLPIAHGEGRYFADSSTLSALEENNQIAYRYCDEGGEVNSTSNPNGALNNIAGIYSKNHKVLGMMPHPERAISVYTGGSHNGVKILQSFLERV